MPTRKDRLLPGGVPRYIRCFDNGGETFDRYTVWFTGRYRHKTLGSTVYVGMSEWPFHPQGFGQHGEINAGLPVRYSGGRRIRFIDLPPDCQRLVLRDYINLWDIQ